ncbi:MAG: hypothetical protein LBN05_00940 [Oscillospiraceae bacterium]|jgi:hypothetical protein|nr:hypothetical protein [Oscillospiraceae bacterium]
MKHFTRLCALLALVFAMVTTFGAVRRTGNYLGTLDTARKGSVVVLKKERTRQEVLEDIINQLLDHPEFPPFGKAKELRISTKKSSFGNLFQEPSQELIAYLENKTGLPVVLSDEKKITGDCLVLTGWSGTCGLGDMLGNIHIDAGISVRNNTVKDSAIGAGFDLVYPEGGSGGMGIEELRIASYHNIAERYDTIFEAKFALVSEMLRNYLIDNANGAEKILIEVSDNSASFTTDEVELCEAVQRQTGISTTFVSPNEIEQHAKEKDKKYVLLRSERDEFSGEDARRLNALWLDKPGKVFTNYQHPTEMSEANPLRHTGLGYYIGAYVDIYEDPTALYK